MPRTDLNVPFEEKNEAKRLGARWDPARKVWFVPDGVDPRPFRNWLPRPADVNVRSSMYYLAETVELCWKCGEPSRVFGIAVPAGYESAEYDDEGNKTWESTGDMAFLSYIEYLPESVQTRIRVLTTHYWLDFSKTTNSSYWMNHCEPCGMKQGDHELFHEPHGAFLPMTPEDARAIKLHPVSERFEADASYTESEAFQYIQAW
jgi:hypothetical protein